MDDYKKKYLKYKNKYFELINRRILTGGTQEDLAWLKLRYPSGAYNEALAISGIMESECNKDEFKSEEIQENLLGFLFWLDSWHDFLQGRAKVDIRETSEYKISNHKDKHKLTITTDTDFLLEEDKKNIIDKVLTDIFPGKHNPLPNQKFKNWKYYMTLSINKNDIITTNGSFERTIENYFEEAECFNHIKSISEGVTIQMDLKLWKDYATPNSQNSLIDKVTKMMEQGDKVLIFEYDNEIKEILKKIKTDLQNGKVTKTLTTEEQEAIKHIQTALIKFLNIDEENLSVGIDAGLGQFKPFFYNKLKLYNNENGKITKLITPQIKGDSAMTGGGKTKTKGPIWCQDIKKKDTITNITLTQGNDEIELWELHSTVCTSPHFIRWFYKNSDSNDSKCNNTDKDLFEMWITPSSNIVNNVIKEENNVWKSCFKKNMSRGLSVKELSFLIEQTYHSIDQNDFNERIDIFFDVFKEDEGHFDIGDILKNLYKWGVSNLGKTDITFWTKPQNLSPTTTPELLLNVKRFIILFLLDYKRAGDYEQAYSAKFLIQNDSINKAPYKNLSTTGDIIAGLVYRILQIPLYTVRSTRDIIFSTGEEPLFQNLIKSSLEGLNLIYEKIKNKKFGIDNYAINLPNFNKFSIITQINIKLLIDLILKLLKKGAIKDVINNIISQTKLKIKEDDDFREFFAIKEEEIVINSPFSENIQDLYKDSPNTEEKNTQKLYKIIFKEMKQKLNKLNYLFDFMKNWCEPDIDPNKLVALDKKSFLEAEKSGGEKFNNFKLRYSISKFLGLKLWEFSALYKKINADSAASKLHPTSIEYYFNKLKENMYKNEPNNKAQIAAGDFYNDWHTVDGLTNLNTNDVRIGEGVHGKDNKRLHYFNNIKKDGTEYTSEVGLWDKEMSYSDEKHSDDYNKIYFWWEGRIITPIKEQDENSKNNNVTPGTAEKGDGLKISTLNLIDNNIILYEALKIMDTPIHVNEKGKLAEGPGHRRPEATIKKIKFLTEFSTLINNLKIIQKKGFWREDEWIYNYRPIFTTHDAEYKKGGDPDGGFLKDYSQTIKEIDKQIFKFGKNDADFKWMLDTPPTQPGEKGRIDVNFAYKGVFINTEIDNMFNVVPNGYISIIEEKIKDIYEKELGEVFSMTFPLPSPTSGGTTKKNINTNLNFKIDSPVNKTINNNMIGGEVSWVWLEGDTSSAPSYSYLKNELASNINELDYEFIKDETIECPIYKNKIRSLYIQVEKIINNSIINLIYFIVDYEPMSNYINFTQLFNLEEKYVNITQDQNSGSDKIENFINNTLDLHDGKKLLGHSKTKKIIEDNLSEIYMDIDLELLTEKFTEIIKKYLYKNNSLLFIFYLIQIIKIHTSNYVNDTILTKLDKLTEKNEYMKEFIDIIKKVNESEEQNTYIICHIILHFYVGLSETWLDKSKMFCKSREVTTLMTDPLTLNNLVDVHLCKLNEQIKKYMPKMES